MLPILAGIVLLYLGAEGLVRGSASLAIRAGVHPLVVGLTVVAFGTSAPELTVSVSAAMKNLGEVAVGNVVGSNIFNIAIILGISSLLRPPTIHLNLLRRDIPIMMGVSLLGFALIAFGSVGRIAGLALLALLAAYLVLTVRLARREKAIPAGEFPPPDAPSRTPLWLDLLLVAAGLSLLVWGANLFVAGAIDLARTLGVSEAVIALTIVAGGTSLPELATSIVAAVKKQPDIAVGNVVGSNIFNILCILGATAAVRPIDVGGIGLGDAAVMLGLSVVLLPLAVTQRRISRPEGLGLLLAYAAYLAWRWPM